MSDASLRVQVSDGENLLIGEFGIAVFLSVPSLVPAASFGHHI